VAFGPDHLVAIAPGTSSRRGDTPWVVWSAPSRVMPQVPSIGSVCRMPGPAGE
jgi:hypothetical protein